jgi:hypothetical protein
MQLVNQMHKMCESGLDFIEQSSRRSGKNFRYNRREFDDALLYSIRRFAVVFVQAFLLCKVSRQTGGYAMLANIEEFFGRIVLYVALHCSAEKRHAFDFVTKV